MSVATTPPLPGAEILDPKRFEAGYPHAEWARLRRESPVHWCERDEAESFWAITRHEDIVSVSRTPEVFESSPQMFINYEPETGEVEPPRRMLPNMDPPEHRAYRSLVNHRFTPRALRSMTSQVDRIADEILDGVMEGGEEAETDFVASISARLPIWVIAEMLGVPRSDWELLFDWTNRIIGATDPEFRDKGMSSRATTDAARAALFQYFGEMTVDRRKNPRDDLVSILANAEIDGQPLPPLELLSYYLALVVAGNETTRNATSGGLLALIENPAELEKVRRDPSLLKSLVEEILRWTSPAIHFCRTPNRDVTVRGQRIRAGDRMALFYPSANRDEDVFDEPDRFRADRHPNRHLALGVGEHVCLGAHVARLELEVIFRHLIQRLDHVELAGPIERLRSSLVGGIKHMPIRYRLGAA